MANEEVISYKGADIQKRIPGLLETIMLDDIAVELRKLNQHNAKAEFNGTITSFILAVTNAKQEKLIIPGSHEWISASFINSGPNISEVLINGDGDWVILPVNIPVNIDFSGADRKIEKFEYQCTTAGFTASVVVIGKY
jgi:hypothetical protein